MVNAIPRKRVCLHSPAKINLSLEVLRRREDGFHEIRSVARGIDLHDTLSIEATGDRELTLTCNVDDLPTDERNLIVQAWRALADSQGASISLDKRIPIGAGLGGGSSNAAAALLAMNDLFAMGCSLDELARIGSKIGSDVALFFHLPAVRLSGRGECVEPIALSWSGFVLLAYAERPVSTACVYAAWKLADRRADVDMNALTEARLADTLAELCSNDLEPAVCRVAPWAGELWERVGAHMPRPARISGAGGTVFALFDDRLEAEYFRDKLKDDTRRVETDIVPTLAHSLTLD